MAYTRPWDQVMNLPGSRDADEIDDENREGHVDFTERFNDIIQGGAAADPWKLVGSFLVTRYLWSIGTPGTVSSGTLGVGSAVGPNADGASVAIHVPVIVPLGAKLAGVKFQVNASGAGTAIQASVYKVFANGSVIGLGTPASPVGTGWQSINVGAISDVAADGDSYLATVLLTNGTGTFARFGSFEVTLEKA